ncbi:hypothetical protein ASD00_36255 [Ensifer sp. Root31]|nr:hypothetical protein ASD00_36255 [Ensifer sp. Root31]
MAYPLTLNPTCGEVDGIRWRALVGRLIADHCYRHEHRLLRADLGRGTRGQPGIPTPNIQQTAIDAPAPSNGRDVHSGFRAFRKDPRLLLVSPIPPLATTRDHLDPTIFSLMPGFMHAFIHDFKHGISAISNHPVPLLSVKELISRPRSQKERWAVRSAHNAPIISRS